ncbi:hypothetical protein [Derxia lacustris]|uniref:hypothetical protein n=1 Tax=Derxia lacustris TaxID=764842 RepID=UPI000A172961|nr:hypothetical protein [Derxia lacustris]
MNLAARLRARARLAPGTAGRCACAGALLALAACATAPERPFTVTDGRTESRFGDARNTARGAELLMADDAFTPPLPDRLVAALEEAFGKTLTGHALRIERADATMFVEDAHVQMARSSFVDRLRRFSFSGNEVPVFRDVHPGAAHSVTVRFAASIDGRRFAGEALASWRGDNGDVELANAVRAALTNTINDARAKLR